MAFKEYEKLIVGGKEFPNVPFQMTISNRSYCKRYSLPYQTMLTITQVRYSSKHKQIRYSLLDAIFDFPWDEESCDTIDLFLPN